MSIKIKYLKKVEHRVLLHNHTGDLAMLTNRFLQNIMLFLTIAIFAYGCTPARTNVKQVPTSKKPQSSTNSQVKIQDDWTALMIALKNGDTQKVKNLLANGADVNAKRDNGVTALYIAAHDGHTEIVKELLSKGAEVNAKKELEAVLEKMKSLFQKTRKIRSRIN